jgi:hypothetical protein
MVLHFWNWLRDNDAPNWFVLAFSLIPWPASLYWWSTHKRQGIPHFGVHPQPPGQTAISGKSFDAVDLIFTNRTGRVVYLSRARLRECRKRFPIPLDAAKDISGGWRELKFNRSSPGLFTDDECILQTNDRVMTSIAVSQPMSQAFYSYRPGWVRRCFRCPEIFSAPVYSDGRREKVLRRDRALTALLRR